VVGQVFSKNGEKLRIYQWILSLVVFLSLLSPSTAYSWSENIRRAYTLEVFRNPGLNETSMRYMGAASLVAQGKMSREEALLHVNTLGMDKIKALLKQDFQIKYFEIPVDIFRALGEAAHQKLSGDSQNQQVIVRDGKKYVRWFMHPLHDSKYMESKFSAYRGQENIRALLTSSRSLVIWDPKTNEEWSLKTSLNKAAGPFKNKAYSSIAAAYHFEMSQIIDADLFLKAHFFVDESFISMTNADFNEGQIVRSLKPYKSGESMMALASLLDASLGKAVAAKNGYGDNWQQFIIDKIAPEIGVISAHLYEKYGLAHNSLHSQNIVVSFDKNGKFSGVRFRDPDFDANLEKYRQVFGDSKADEFIAKSNIRNSKNIAVDFSVLNGVTLAMTDNQKQSFYKKLGQSFSAAFLSKVADLRGDQRLAKTEIQRRVSESVYIDSGSMGARAAISLIGPMIEELLDPNADIKAYEDQKQTNQKFKSAQEAHEFLVSQIREQGSKIQNYNELQVTQAWDRLNEEMVKNPSQSELKKILNQGDRDVLWDLIVMLNMNQDLKIEPLMNEVFKNHRDLLKTVDFSSIFNKHVNEVLMKDFITLAPSNVIADLWPFKKANKLLTYSEPILNRFFAKIDNETFQTISNELEKTLNAASSATDLNIRAENAKIERVLKIRQALQDRRGGGQCSPLFN
jgi:hypothetical protein